MIDGGDKVGKVLYLWCLGFTNANVPLSMIPSIMYKWKQNTWGTYAQKFLDFGTWKYFQEIWFGCSKESHSGIW